MGTRDDAEEARCKEARKFEATDAAFRAGDLEALRVAVDDPSLVPNGVLQPGIGAVPGGAVDHSPLRFIRQLLEIGANPSPESDDGFPPLIAAITCGRVEPGFATRDDVPQLVRLLLAFGADPDQRGINDYTALHIAVAERNGQVVQLLLDAGADPGLRTRIDDNETPLEMAEHAGLRDIAAILARQGRPANRRLRSGLELLVDVGGSGELVRRQHDYVVRLRMWLNDGEPVRWQTRQARSPPHASKTKGPLSSPRFESIAAESSAGSSTAWKACGWGGMRRLRIAPDLAYGAPGVPGLIPPRATLTAEISDLGCGWRRRAIARAARRGEVAHGVGLRAMEKGRMNPSAQTTAGQRSAHMGVAIRGGAILGILVVIWQFVMGLTGWYTNP